MSYYDLLRGIEENFTELPIQVDDVAKVLIDMGMTDEVVVAKMDEPALDGMFIKELRHDAVYALPKTVSIAWYSENLEIDEQRLVCFKELVHVLDPKLAETKTIEDIDTLIERLTVEYLGEEEVSVEEYHALIDRFAVFKALPILLPLPIRHKLKKELDAGKITVEDVASQARMPLHIAILMMSDDWPSMQAIIEGMDTTKPK